MAETIAGNMIVADFDDERGLKRMPGVFFALIPATGSHGSRSGEVRRCDGFSALVGRSLASGTALSAISYQALEKGLPHASLFALPDPIIRIILISTDDASVYE